MVKTFLRAIVCGCLGVALLALFSSPRALGQTTNPFFTPPTFAGSGRTLTADLNGDGKPDLLFSDGTILLGKGDGTFTTGTPWVGTTAPQIVIADFNGDGKQDLLLPGTLNQLVVYLGNGDGTFQAPVITSIASPPTSFVVGDLNGDGKIDVLAQVGSMFFTYLGKGDGNFIAGIASNAVDASIFDSFADFNGDGKLDLFVAGQGIQLGNGDGTFQALVPFPGISGGLLGDFNGDGRLDVLGSPTGTSNPLQIQVIFGNGDGTFNPGPVQTLPAGTTTGDLIAVDLNGDGKDDLVGFTSQAMQVIIGKGDGTFTAGKFYSTPQGSSSAGFDAIVIADFNGDHKKDVAAFNTMLLGNGDGTFQGDEAVPAMTGNGASGDFNGDGFPDFALIASSSNSVNSVLEIWLNDGKSNFTLAQTYQIPIPVPGNFGGGVIVYSATDVNGDGKVDLEAVLGDATGLTLLTLLGNGDGSFGTPISSRINNDMYGSVTGFTLGDANGDGKPDALLNAVGRAGCCSAFYVLLNNGDGSFGAPTMPFVGAPQGSLVAGDFNGDKKLDVIMGTTSGIAIALGNGDGTFQPTTFNTSSACTALCHDPLSGDFNGDGKLDLIIQDSGGYQVLLGNGDGTFTLSPPVTAGPLFFYSTAGLVADINGDGHLDIVGSTGTGLALILGNGDGTFGPVFSLPVFIPINGSGTGTPLIGDFNGDGRPDIALLTPAQLVWLFNNGPAGTGTTPPPGPPDFSVGSGSGGGTATVTAGSTATYPISLAGSGGFTGTVALKCSVAPAGPACSVSPSSVTVNGSAAATATVSVTTTARSELSPISVPRDRDAPHTILWLFGALLAAVGMCTLFGSTLKRPRRFSWSFATACAAILLVFTSLLAGCGQGSNSSAGSGGSTATGTTAGNYTVTVTAQSGAAVHKAQLTLTVH